MRAIFKYPKEFHIWFCSRGGKIKGQWSEICRDKIWLKQQTIRGNGCKPFLIDDIKAEWGDHPITSVMFRVYTYMHWKVGLEGISDSFQLALGDRSL